MKRAMKKESHLLHICFIYASILLLYCVIHDFEYLYYNDGSAPVIWLHFNRDFALKCVYEACSLVTIIFIGYNVIRQLIEALLIYSKSFSSEENNYRPEKFALHAVSFTLAAFFYSLIIEFSNGGPITTSILLYNRTANALPEIPKGLPVEWLSMRDIIAFVILFCYTVAFFIISPHMKKWMLATNNNRASDFFGKMRLFVLLIIFMPAVFSSFLYSLALGNYNIENCLNYFPVNLTQKGLLKYLFSEKRQLSMTLILSFFYVAVTRYVSIISDLRGIYIIISIFIFAFLCILILLMMSWVSIIDTTISVSVSDEIDNVDDWPQGILALHDSYLQARQELQTLQKEYDKVIQHDKNWMNLFLHALVNESKGFTKTINDYENVGLIPYENIKPAANKLDQIVYDCFLLGEAIAGRRPTIDEKAPAYFIKVYRDSHGKFQDMLRPYITSGQIHLDMHGLENDHVEIDLEKTKTIIEILLTNAMDYALPNTIISIDYSEDNEKHSLTVSNIIKPEKEEEIRMRLAVIDEFWSRGDQDAPQKGNTSVALANKSFCEVEDQDAPQKGDKSVALADKSFCEMEDKNASSKRDKSVHLGLILAKINAENMGATFTYNIEDHLRFVARLTV